MKINFFWYGEDFTQWDFLCLSSHIKVGHEVVIWLAGQEPSNDLWKKLKQSSSVIIKDVDDMINTKDFLEQGGNPQTLSAKWRFKFLYHSGGWYADTDAYALQKWTTEHDNGWVVASAEEDRKTLSIGVLRAPAFSPVFVECSKNIKHKWGNVKVFDKSFRKVYSDWKPNIQDIEYYPWTWKSWNNLYDKDITINSLMLQGVKSIHLYTTMLKRNNADFNVKDQCLLKDMIDYAR
jgi:hypothetical protein